MTKLSLFLRTIHRSQRSNSICRLPLVSFVNLRTSDPLTAIAVCGAKERLYSSYDVSHLNEIYNSPKSKHIFLVKIMSLTTSLTAVLFEIAVLKSTELSLAAKNGFSVATSLVFATPLLNHLIFRRFVTRMYYNEENDSYTAVVFTIFATRRYITFTVEDVEPLKVEICSTVRIKGSPVFLDPINFTDIVHYKRIMKYDKPIDFGVDADEFKDDYEKFKNEKQKMKAVKEEAK